MCVKNGFENKVMFVKIEMGAWRFAVHTSRLAPLRNSWAFEGGVGYLRAHQCNSIRVYNAIHRYLGTRGLNR